MNTDNLPRATSQDIQNVIDAFCDEDRIFSKYDVTKQLRHNGFFIEHDDVKQVLNMSNKPSGYDLEIIRIQSSSVFVYCHKHHPCLSLFLMDYSGEMGVPGF